MTDADLLRAASTGSGTNSAAATVPASLQPGDALLLIAAANLDATLTAPPGWAPVGPQQQPAAADDAGSAVAVTNDGVTGVKAQVLLLAYAGTDPVAPLHLTAPLLHGNGLASHSAPQIVTTLPDCEIVQVCLSKSSNAFTWTATPGGTEIRAPLIGTGGGHINSIAVSHGPARPGTWGGGVFTEDANANSAVTFTIALAPKTAVQSLRPALDVRSDSYTAVPVAEAGVAMATRIGESTRDDGTYLQTPPGSTGAVYETRLAAGWDPNVSTDHTWTVVLSSGGGATSSTCRVELLQDATLIAGQTLTGIPTTPTPYSYTLTPDETDQITDYTNLRLRFTWTVT